MEENIMGFMSPETTKEPFVTVTHTNGESYSCPEGCEDLRDGDETERIPSAWWARLSASGYMDCTEWDGPFKTKREALASLAETFDLCPKCFEDHDGERCEG